MIAAKLARRHLYPIVVVTALLAGSACSDNPEQPIEGAGDPENISRVTVTLTPLGGGTAVSSARVDPDGTQLPLPVGAAQGTLALTKGKTYTGTVALLNDIDPKNVVDISAEVKKESDFHRFFYVFSCAGSSDVTVGNLDVDSQSPPQPFGINFQVTVSATAPSTSSCTLNVQLHHFEQNKGDGSGTNFETDLDIDFPVTIS